MLSRVFEHFYFSGIRFRAMSRCSGPFARVWAAGNYIGLAAHGETNSHLNTLQVLNINVLYLNKPYHPNKNAR